jgi:hypothetical protein
MHAMTQKEFQEIRDQRYTIITFELGRRRSTYGGLGLARLMREIGYANKARLRYVIFTEEEIQAGKIDIGRWDMAYFYDRI